MRDRSRKSKVWGSKSLVTRSLGKWLERWKLLQGRWCLITKIWTRNPVKTAQVLRSIRGIGLRESLRNAPRRTLVLIDLRLWRQYKIVILRHRIARLRLTAPRLDTLRAVPPLRTKILRSPPVLLRGRESLARKETWGVSAAAFSLASWPE